MIKQLDLIFEKGATKDDYSMLFSIMPHNDLAEEFLAYEKEDWSSLEYIALVDEISKRKDEKDSLKKWAVKYHLTDSKKKDLEFYDVLNRQGLTPEGSEVFYLRQAIREVYGYSSLNDKSKTETRNGKSVRVRTRTPLNSLDDSFVRSFAKNRYLHGEEVRCSLNG